MMIIKNSSFADLIESYISPFVQRIMHQKHITGLSVALVGDSQVLFSKGYGFADIQTRKHATPSTLYKIGSITKVFTGTAAMQLAEKGLLDLSMQSRNVPFSAK